jgi:predicted RNA-binding Zn ribbon-like protein
MFMLEHETQSLNLESGRLCLDFANTADWHTSDQPEEQLNSYTDLVEWAKGVGILTEGQARQLASAAMNRSAEVADVLARAIDLREAIFRIFSAVSRRASPGEADLAVLNEVLSAALGRLHLVSTPDGFGWEWNAGRDNLDQMLWPVAQSAADLLTSEELNRVGQCADDHCGWLFMDMSRNRSRRWCDMGDCGNRAKARRHYQRKRSIGSTDVGKK